MPATAPVLVIHAGAGDAGTESGEREGTCRDALLAAVEAGRRVLEAGGDAVDAAQAAVAEMESCEVFNAGRGSALCSDGSVQMSAAVMRGSDRAAGAVAGVTRTEHPILAARFVLDSEQVLVAGEWADRRAVALGAVERDNSFFVTERQRARLDARPPDAAPDGGTVGAVCLDARGMLAAATSTGGVSGQPPGRVGDSPLIGAGTWADERIAVSCTGDGEAFIRAGAARQIAMRVQGGIALADATERALADVAALGGRGGLIAVDSTGAASTPLLSKVMPGGRWRSRCEPVAWVAGPPGAFDRAQ